MKAHYNHRGGRVRILFWSMLNKEPCDTWRRNRWRDLVVCDFAQFGKMLGYTCPGLVTQDMACGAGAG